MKNPQLSLKKTTFCLSFINAFRLLVIVGLRPGELCDLRRTKQTDKCTLAISGNYNRFGERTKGKTKNAIRHFVLPSYGVKIMDDQRKLLIKARIASKYLFPIIDREQSTSAQIYKRWKRFARANEIADVSLYELRHTFVSMCKGSIPERLIKPVVGHSSKMPTYNTYGHAMDVELEMVAQIIEEAYSEIINNKRG
ncbi:MAG: tyrosine-type recombinase/integrase [Christensenellales bacterium]|jgi:integrase